MALACSVVIPAFNAAGTLGEQLTALASQDFAGQFEVLVADNGSTDDLAQVVQDHSAGLDVRVVDASARRGPSAARNIGAQAARTDRLLFCDADDIVSAVWVRALVHGLESQPFVGGPYWPFSEKEGIWLPKYDLDGLPTAWSGRPYAFGGNFGVTAHVWQRLSGFDESLTGAEEIEFAWRAYDADVPPAYVPEAVVNYRVRASVRGRLWHEYNSGRGTSMLAARVMPSANAERSWKSQLRHNLMLAARFPRRLDGPSWAAWAATLAFEAGARSGRQRVRDE